MSEAFSFESLVSRDHAEFASAMKQFGYCIVTLNDHPLKQQYMHWESLFAAGFDLDQHVKGASPYRSVCNGLAIGYRRDDEREFLETRLTFTSNESDKSVRIDVDPILPIPSDEVYRSRVCQLWTLLREIGQNAVACMCTAIGVDPAYALRLMDSNEVQDSHSSSVLRICRYPPAAETSLPPVVFGAHTDTSFVTVAPCSSVAGLQMQHNGEWRSVETSREHVIVFVGEIMQILTRHHYRAAVHRVIASSAWRISCPFIIRGAQKVLLTSPDDVMYAHSNHEAAMTILANLEGVTMKHIHKILDLRRARCRKKHEDDENEWVLCAYDCGEIT